jgi:hypothetical protein
LKDSASLLFFAFFPCGHTPSVGWVKYDDKKKKKGQKQNNEAESLKHMKIKYPTHEDGHVCRNM